MVIVRRLAFDNGKPKTLNLLLTCRRATKQLQIEKNLQQPVKFWWFA